jgi:hypothetical protein
MRHGGMCCAINCVKIKKLTFKQPGSYKPGNELLKTWIIALCTLFYLLPLCSWTYLWIKRTNYSHVRKYWSAQSARFSFHENRLSSGLKSVSGHEHSLSFKLTSTSGHENNLSIGLTEMSGQENILSFGPKGVRAWKQIVLWVWKCTQRWYYIVLSASTNVRAWKLIVLRAYNCART